MGSHFISTPSPSPAFPFDSFPRHHSYHSEGLEAIPGPETGWQTSRNGEWSAARDSSRIVTISFWPLGNVSSRECVVKPADTVRFRRLRWKLLRALFTVVVMYLVKSPRRCHKYSDRRVGGALEILNSSSSQIWFVVARPWLELDRPLNRIAGTRSGVMKEVRGFFVPARSVASFRSNGG